MKFLIGILSFVLCFVGTFESAAQVVVKVKPNKPKVVVMKPAKANPGHVWIDGHWKWDKPSHQYIWVKGHWIKEKKGHTWVPGHWKSAPSGHEWVPGHWKKGGHPKHGHKHHPHH